MCGIRDYTLRKTLLQKGILTLTMCIDICRTAEAASRQLKSIVETESSDVQNQNSILKHDSRRRKETSRITYMTEP